MTEQLEQRIEAERNKLYELERDVHECRNRLRKLELERKITCKDVRAMLMIHGIDDRTIEHITTILTR